MHDNFTEVNLKQEEHLSSQTLALDFQPMWENGFVHHGWGQLLE